MKLQVYLFIYIQKLNEGFQCPLHIRLIIDLEENQCLVLENRQNIALVSKMICLGIRITVYYLVNGFSLNVLNERSHYTRDRRII